MNLVRILSRLARARAAALPLLLWSAAAGACGSASQSVTAPGDVKCSVGASADATSFGPGGGSGTVRVATNRECGWSASASAAWIQLNGTTTGQGEGQIPFGVSPNLETSSRRGVIVVGNAEVAIVQEPAACGFTVAPLAITVAPAGERRAIEVTTNGADCAWTARSDHDWLVILEGSQHSGNGRVVFEARPTTGPTRAGSLVVAGQTVTVTQGNGCSTSVAPLEHSIGASGGSGAVSVTAGPGCAWNASSDVPWITIGAGASGEGPGMVSFTVAAWDGPTRTGTIRVDGQVVTITQMAGCSFAIDPREWSAPAAGGTGTLSVSTADGCAWSASSQSPWIAIESGASGRGEGQVAFRVFSNSGPERTGTLTVAGRAFTVRQASGCAYSIDPASQSFAAEGGTGSTTVTTGAECGWVVGTPSAGWVSAAGGGRTGPGTVSVTVGRNETAEARRATIPIAGQIFTIEQAAAACTYRLSAPGQVFDASEQPGEVGLDTGAGCAWTAVASADWIRITSPESGQGPATISFTVAENTAELRTGSISAGGQVFSITQAAPPAGGL